MTKVWLTLAWKELREQAPKAACLAAMTLVFTGAGISDLAADFSLGATLLGIAGTAFFAVGAVAGEKADNTFAFVRSLPVQRWEVAVIRILVPCLFCMAAIGATALCAHTMIILGVARGVSTDLWTAALFACDGSLSLYFWIAAAAIDQPNQVRAGIVGFFVILAWFAIGIWLQESGELRPSWPSGVIQTILCIGPWGWWGRMEIPPSSPESWTRLIVWQVIANTLLFGVSVLNYGRENTATPFPDETPGESRPLGRPRRSPRRASAKRLAFSASTVLGHRHFRLARNPGCHIRQNPDAPIDRSDDLPQGRQTRGEDQGTHDTHGCGELHDVGRPKVTG